MLRGVIWIRLEHGARSLTLFVAPIGDQPVAAFARGAGRRLVHMDRTIPSEFQASMRALAETLAATSVRESDPALVGRLLAAAHDAGVEARLLRIVAEGHRMPRWDAKVRDGRVPQSNDYFWPSQAEEIGLQLGLRRLIKREGLAANDLKRVKQVLDGAGLNTALSEGALLAATDAHTLRSALEAEASLAGQGARADDAVRFLGEALGYPECCVETFVRMRTRDDPTLAAALLPPLPHARASVLTQWMIAPLALVSHAPCSLYCVSTERLARHILAGIEARAPGFTERWVHATRGLHVIDGAGRCLVLSVDGPLDEGRGAYVHTAKEVLCVDQDRAGLQTRAVAGLVGQALVRDGALVAADLVAALVADHGRPFDEGIE